MKEKSILKGRMTYNVFSARYFNVSFYPHFNRKYERKKSRLEENVRMMNTKSDLENAENRSGDHGLN